MTGQNGDNEDREAYASDATAQGQRAFFGRRKGHKLRAHQADLIAHLLPRLALDITTPLPADLTGLFDIAVDNIRLEIGFELVDNYSGGGSDGNFTAAFTATLDGLGVDGQGAHTHYEQMYISSIEPRARLLHRLYQTLR